MRTLRHKELIDRCDGNEFVSFIMDGSATHRGHIINITVDGIEVITRAENSRLLWSTIQTICRLLTEMPMEDLKKLHGKTVETFPTFVKGWTLIPVEEIVKIENENFEAGIHDWDCRCSNCQN
jgi:hypothetical protein